MDILYFYDRSTSYDKLHATIPSLCAYNISIIRMHLLSTFSAKNIFYVTILIQINTPPSFSENNVILTPSYKMDLDLWDCFGRKKTHLNPKKYSTYLVQGKRI